MTGGEKYGQPPIFSLLFLLCLLLLSSATSATQARSLAESTGNKTDDTSQPEVKFTPSDNYLVACGAQSIVKLEDGRTFRSDAQSLAYLSTSDNIKIIANNAVNTSSMSPIYRGVRVFTDLSTYKFSVTKPGRHWVRLHFYPLPDPNNNLASAKFTVYTDDTVLLRDFSFPTDITPAEPLIKEYLIVASGDRICLHFTPAKGSIAFINAIELINVPDSLIHSTATGISPEGEFGGIPNYALEVTHRLNVGGPTIQPANDTLSRTWQPDARFLKLQKAAQNVSVAPGTIKYPSDGSVTAFDAPSLVYSSAVEMGNSNVPEPTFNITWEVPSNPAYSYLIRMHFCDIVSKELNRLYFNVYLNGKMAISSLDLSMITTGLAVPYFKDFALNASTIVNSTIYIQVGTVPGSSSSGNPNAILNGIEIMKMSNSARSLDGPYAVDGTYHGDEPEKNRTKKIVAGVGIAMGAVALGLIGVLFYRWRKRPANWEERNSFTSWFMPMHANNTTFTSSSSRGSSRNRYGSHKSKNGYTSYFANGAHGVGRIFTFAELQEATKNFDEKAVIGVGGFGKVYIGELEDGTKLAVKRGNSSSEQGINEFHTEIQMLSKLRHRHLVSLIGCCDENSEMILVYEYMANGPLRDHLYGTSLTPLTWRQRLEACIGAARGLHYLHTGAAQGIIHRDVKTTNILLDENLVAKMADFGLSKAGPSVQQTHVSTAVKGSFGYLDPEYFRSQQLTDKSDVYSFGVVLFEALCARPAINPTLPRDQVNLAEWAMNWNRKGELEKIIDPNLVGTITPASLKKFVEAAEKCLAEYGVDRPSMGDVLWNLEYALQLQEASIGQQNDESSGDSARHIILQSPRHVKHEEGNLATISEDSATVIHYLDPIQLS